MNRSLRFLKNGGRDDPEPKCVKLKSPRSHLIRLPDKESGNPLQYSCWHYSARMPRLRSLRGNVPVCWVMKGQNVGWVIRQLGSSWWVGKPHPETSRELQSLTPRSCAHHFWFIEGGITCELQQLTWLDDSESRRFSKSELRSYNLEQENSHSWVPTPICVDNNLITRTKYSIFFCH